jgi:hypothetical protein
VWKRRLTNCFARGWKLARLPRYVNVGVLHLIVSPMRSSAPSISSLVRRTASFIGFSYRSNQASTSGLRVPIGQSSGWPAATPWPALIVRSWVSSVAAVFIWKRDGGAAAASRTISSSVKSYPYRMAATFSST